MGVYRMATVTLWQTDDKAIVKGHYDVFLRYGARDFQTLARGELTSSAPVDKPPGEWLLEALAEWLARDT